MNYVKKFFTAIKNAVKAIFLGELLLRMRLDRFFIHILYTFLMFWIAILTSMMVQNTLVKVEKNKAKIAELKIYHAQKTVKLVSLGRLETVEEQLSRRGSEISSPEKPAARIE